jgi:hypothetical protein
MGGSAAETIRLPRDRLIGQPRECQHSDAEGGTGTDCPGEEHNTILFARGSVTGWPGRASGSGTPAKAVE